MRAHTERAKRDEVESANPDESRLRREIGDIEGLIPMKLHSGCSEPQAAGNKAL
jgi:hypothetical protein